MKTIKQKKAKRKLSGFKTFKNLRKWFHMKPQFQFKPQYSKFDDNFTISI